MYQKVFFLIAICWARVAAPGAAAAAETVAYNWDARLLDYSGSVLVRQAGGSLWANARKGLPLNPGDTVKTGKRSRADIGLDSKCLVSLAAASEVGLDRLDRRDSALSLARGRTLLKLAGLKKFSRKFKVSTPSAVAAVRGTEFAVSFDRDLGETLVNVFEEGEVVVTSLDESGNPVGESISVIPRHEVRVRKEMEAMTLNQSPPARYKDPGMAAVRRKLYELEKSYKPMKKESRELDRSRTFGEAAGAAAPRGERGADPAAMAEKPRQKKGGASGRDGAGEPGYGEEGDQRAGARPYGGRPGQGGYQAQSGRAARSGESSAASEDGGDEGGYRLGSLGGQGRKKGGHAGGHDGGGGKAGAILGGRPGGDGGQDGSRPKSASAGDSNPPLIRPGVGGAFTRPVSAEDKGVDSIVSRVQQSLASSGAEGAISSPELRTMVIGAAKATSTDSAFISALNASLTERLSAANLSESGSATSVTTLQSAGAVKSAVTLTSPNITSPVMGPGKTAVTNTGTREISPKTTIKRQ